MAIDSKCLDEVLQEVKKHGFLFHAVYIPVDGGSQNFEIYTQQVADIIAGRTSVEEIAAACFKVPLDEWRKIATFFKNYSTCTSPGCKKRANSAGHNYDEFRWGVDDRCQWHRE